MSNLYGKDRVKLELITEEHMLPFIYLRHHP